MRLLHRSAHSPRRRGRAVAAALALGLGLGASAMTTDVSAGSEPPAEASGLLAELQEAGVARVGIAFEPPYGYLDADGQPTGQAPTVAKAVLAELGIDNIEAYVVPFGSLIPGLQAGQYDLIAAGMFINAERASQIIFSDPDYCVSEAFAVPEGNPMNISDYQSIIDSGALLAMVPGTVEVGYAEMAGVPDDQLVQFGTIEEQYPALENGRVDVVPGTRLTVEERVETMDGFEATEPFFPLDEDGNEILGCGGYGFLDQGFRDAFNEVLAEKQADGTVTEILVEFGFTEEEAELAMEQTVEGIIGGGDAEEAPAGSEADG